MILGEGKYQYETCPDWAKLPDGWSFHECADVAVDSNNNVYVCNRGLHPIIVFNEDGDFLRSFGEGKFGRAHSITYTPDDALFCTDDANHTVTKYTLEGKELFTIGCSCHPAPAMSGKPFNRCTHVAVDPYDGCFYISDGYANAVIHKYSPEGKLLFSWGEPGTNPGQFNLPHNVCVDNERWVYVADRENQRIQVFNPDGKYESQIVNMARPCGLHIDNINTNLMYVGELRCNDYEFITAKACGLGPRVSILDLDGNVLVRLGDVLQSDADGHFTAPHGITTDLKGDIYVAEVSYGQYGLRLPNPREVRSLQKLKRIRVES